MAREVSKGKRNNLKIEIMQGKISCNEKPKSILFPLPKKICVKVHMTRNFLLAYSKELSK